MTIYQALGISKLDYLNHVTKTYNIWCEWLSYKCITPMHEFQASKSLYLWFYNQFQMRVESTFLQENKDFLDANIKAPKHYRDLFNTILKRKNSNLIGVYPKPLIEQIRKAHYDAILKQDNNTKKSTNRTKSK